MSILVLHGHKSNSKSSVVCQIIKEKFDDVIAVDYPSDSPREEIAEFFRELPINWVEVDAIIGSSLGGYWARYLGREKMVNTIMVNPALQFYNDDDNDPRDLPMLLIVCADDTVINPDYAREKYKDRCKIVTLDSGGHRCETLELCIDEIKRMMNTIVWIADD